MNRHLLTLLMAAGLAVSAAGDVVHLRNGNTLEGQVEKTDDGVIVNLPAGQVRITNDAIDRIEEKPSVIEQFKERAADLEPDDAEGHFALAQWAGRNHLKEEAEALYRQVIGIDPNHAGAREALGHRLVDGKWMTEAQAMAARGLVEYNGQWMSPEAASKLRELETQLEVAREERKAAEAELERAEKELEYAEREPPVGYNPYDQYYANRDIDRYRQRYYYYGVPYGYGGYPYYYDRGFGPFGFSFTIPFGDRHHRRRHGFHGFKHFKRH
jgi:hypothetical protein